MSVGEEAGRCRLRSSSGLVNLFFISSASGGGSMVGALVGSTQREPQVVGKPSTFMMDYLANKYDAEFLSHSYMLIRMFSNDLIGEFSEYTRFGIQKSQICMVGDRLDTDILFGQNGGCKTLLDFSFLIIGVTSLSMLQNPNNSIQPDFYTNKISDFLSLELLLCKGHDIIDLACVSRPSYPVSTCVVVLVTFDLPAKGLLAPSQ
ncbi:hypothetical protein C3L33_20033, partial [Rhododendron williamsianum]